MGGGRGEGGRRMGGREEGGRRKEEGGRRREEGEGAAGKSRNLVNRIFDTVLLINFGDFQEFL
jgi:hypothetical protein